MRSLRPLADGSRVQTRRPDKSEPSRRSSGPARYETHRPSCTYHFTAHEVDTVNACGGRERDRKRRDGNRRRRRATMGPCRVNQGLRSRTSRSRRSATARWTRTSRSARAAAGGTRRPTNTRPSTASSSAARPAVGDFVWCPEGLREADARLLGPPEDLVGRRVLEVGRRGGAVRPLARRAGAQPGRARPVRRPAAARAGPGGRGRADRPAGPGRRHACCPSRDASVDLACSAFGAVPFVADSAALHREVARVLRPGRPLGLLGQPPDALVLPGRPGPGGAGRRALLLRPERLPRARRGRAPGLRRVAPHDGRPRPRARRRRLRGARRRRAGVAGGARPRVGPVEPAARPAVPGHRHLRHPSAPADR